MIYKFKSKAAGDVIMLGQNGDELLRLIGRSPAEKGIIEAAALPAAIAALEAAVAASEPQPAADDDDGGRAGDGGRSVGLRQRVWPMVEMLRRAQASGHSVVWGV